MAVTPALTAEEKARILQALREDAAFREEIGRLLLEDVRTSIHELREIIDRLATVVREGFEAVHQDIRALTEQVRENSRQIQENSRQIAALAQRMDALTGQVQENGRQIAALAQRMDALTGQVQENSRQIAGLTEQVRENSRQIAALTERMARVETQLLALTEQVQENSRHIAALTEQVQENSRHIAALTGEVREQRIRLDDVSGIAVEASAREEIYTWLRSRGVEIVERCLPGDLLDHLEVRSVPDGVMVVRNRDGYVFLVYEITFTIALRDVQRIAEWLEGFRKVAWPAIGLVYYRRALPEEDEVRHISEDGREIIQTIPGMRTLREEAARAGVLLMQHGASPWRPEDWQPPQGLKCLPEVLQLGRDWW